ncbi:MAG TPA: cell division protein FtsL [Syntrophomonadaceae bacterium]|jgi:cell division protein FtsL|nr:cell division protein FtsL [Syntrophomonadaceae bacterium]
MQQAEARAYKSHRGTAADYSAPVQGETIVIRKIRKRKVNYGRKILVKAGMLVFVYALLLVFLCCQSAVLSYQIEDLEKEVKKLEASYQRTEYQISQQSSLARVEQVAVNELGMYKPDAGVFVSVEYQPSAKDIQLASGDVQASSKVNRENALYKIYRNLVQLANK